MMQALTGNLKTSHVAIIATSIAVGCTCVCHAYIHYYNYYLCAPPFDESGYGPVTCHNYYHV